MTLSPTDSQIILIEADKALREALSHVLSMEKHDVRGFDHMDAALAAWNPKMTSLIIVELDNFQAPESGPRAIRRAGFAGPILAMSTNGENEVPALATGADAFLRKPLRIPQLFHEITRLLTTPHS